jgi:hypothetical protein
MSCAIVVVPNRFNDRDFCGSYGLSISGAIIERVEFGEYTRPVRAAASAAAPAHGAFLAPRDEMW